jgi:uncharacterized protein with FMN-binding domain
MRIAAALVLCLSLAAAGCTPVALREDVPPKMSDGTFEGRAFKFPARLVVSLTVKDGKMTSIEIEKHPAPPKYTRLMKQLAATMIEKQSTKVDGITGATISSNAFKKAVADALGKASAPQE